MLFRSLLQAELEARHAGLRFARRKAGLVQSTEADLQALVAAIRADGVNAVRLYDAMRNNDKEAIREVVTQAGGPNSQGYKNLVAKIGAMQKLIGGQ